MKEIKAYIKPHKLSQVVAALHSVEGLTGMSVLDVRGFGRTRREDSHRGIVEDGIEYVPHVKMEIVCRDELVDQVVSVIQTNAHTSLRGDGKIYVSNVEEAVRISTGERGEVAV
ncbi:MAG: P-II family nitrogen regulator [Planctomycetes bacterium]|nr:P-II family nitrogen regulator [Planctomycetota bacterium]